MKYWKVVEAFIVTCVLFVAIIVGAKFLIFTLEWMVQPGDIYGRAMVVGTIAFLVLWGFITTAIMKDK
jgi:hypothetical protein